MTGTTYRFQVRAINYIGNGPLSSVGSLLSAAPPDMPTAPFIVAATETQITIGWGIVSNGGAPIEGYTILMAAIPTTTVGRLLQGTIWVDVTNSGVIDFVNNRFTTANNLVKGFTY